MHPVKELHYFDTLCGLTPESANKRQAAKRLRRDLVTLGRRPLRQSLVSISTNRFIARRDFSTYSYRDLYYNFPRRKKYIGEITPEYMLLPECGIVRLREAVGDARIILMTRDPIERVVSAMKLLLRGMKEERRPATDVDKDRHLLSVLRSKSQKWVTRQQRFNDFDGALHLYQKHFTGVLTVDYQDLAVSGRIDQSLQDFLGVSFNEKRYRSKSTRTVNSFFADYQPGDAVMDEVHRLFGI
ncbi:Uncharacterised protein [Halioglobus japonicus]|nr:Uncharacterised protein [Halioglobus japonicus]